MIPPTLARISIQGPRHAIGFWLPLFLIWPFVVLVLVLLSPFLFIGFIVLWFLNLEKGIGRFLLGLYEFICAAKGLVVEASAPHATVKVLIK